jgi:hypothetical protein
MKAGGFHLSLPAGTGGGGGPDVLYDLIANRPAANTVASGTRFVATDIGLEYWSDATSWYLIDQADTPLSNVTITYNGNGTVNTVVNAQRTLTFGYTGPLLTSVVSSEGWTKTLNYTGDDLTGVTLS